jgi:hypothetical protein
LPGGHAPDGVLYYVLYKQKEEFEGEMIWWTTQNISYALTMWVGYGMGH